jgi:hypothetical protein
MPSSDDSPEFLKLRANLDAAHQLVQEAQAKALEAQTMALEAEAKAARVEAINADLLGLSGISCAARRLTIRPSWP